MANTFSQIYIHLVFAVKNREALIPAMIRPRIHAYIGGIVRELGHTPIAVGGTDNHVHVLIGYNITKLIPDLMREVKSSTTNFINSNHLIPFKFGWQRGYACFSYSHSHIPKVVEYIKNQVEHHKSMTFIDELKRELDLRGIDYDMQYLFDDL